MQLAGDQIYFITMKRKNKKQKRYENTLKKIKPLNVSFIVT